MGGPEQTARASALDYALWGGAGTLAGAAVVAAVALLAVQPGRTRVPDTVLGSYPVFQ